MAYDEEVAARVRAALEGQRDVVEKRMFGGIVFMIAGNMSVGVVGDELMVRVGPEAYAEALAQPHAREMDFTGKPLRGFVYVESAGFKGAAALRTWIGRGASFARSLPPK